MPPISTAQARSKPSPPTLSEVYGVYGLTGVPSLTLGTGVTVGIAERIVRIGVAVRDAGNTGKLQRIGRIFRDIGVRQSVIDAGGRFVAHAALSRKPCCVRYERILRMYCVIDFGGNCAIACQRVRNRRVADGAARIVHRTSQLIPLVFAQRTVGTNLLCIDLHSGCFRVAVKGIAIDHKVYAVGVGGQILNGVSAEIILDIAAQRTEREAVCSKALVALYLGGRCQEVVAVGADATPVAAVGILCDTGQIGNRAIRMQLRIVGGGRVVRCAEVDSGSGGAASGSNLNRTGCLDVNDRREVALAGRASDSIGFGHVAVGIIGTEHNVRAVAGERERCIGLQIERIEIRHKASGRASVNSVIRIRASGFKAHVTLRFSHGIRGVAKANLCAIDCDRVVDLCQLEVDDVSTIALDAIFQIGIDIDRHGRRAVLHCRVVGQAGVLLDMLAGYRVQDRVRLRGRNHKVFIRGIFLFKRRRYDGSVSRAAGQLDVVRQVIRGTAARQGAILIVVDIRAADRDALDAVGRRTKRTAVSAEAVTVSSPRTMTITRMSARAFFAFMLVLLLYKFSFPVLSDAVRKQKAAPILTAKAVIYIFVHTTLPVSVPAPTSDRVCPPLARSALASSRTSPERQVFFPVVAIQLSARFAI